MKKLAIVIGPKERYIFTEEEFHNCNLFNNGPRQTMCFLNRSNDYTPIMKTWNYEEYKLPDDDPASKYSNPACLETIEIQYGAICNIFRSVEDKPVDWETPVDITFYFDDENEEPGYTKIDNFAASCYWWEVMYPDSPRDWGKSYHRLLVWYGLLGDKK